MIPAAHDSTPARHPWFKFFPSDWQGDELLAMCSLAARGLLAECLCLMHKATPYGYLLVNGRQPSDLEIMRLTRASSAREVSKLRAELLERGVLSRAEDGTLYSRRMVRKGIQSEVGRETGKEGGSPNWRRGTVAKELRVGPLSSQAKARVFEKLWEKCSGRCGFCGAHLTRDGNGPTFAHVDHIVARCDGGTHDESNLRLLCRSCNHLRKNVDAADEPTIEPTSEPTGRTNPQKLEARSQREKEPSVSAVTNPDVADRAGAFVEFYADLYPQLRNGVPYRRQDTLDFPTACSLVSTWDDARLRLMAEIFLRTDHKFAEEGRRSIRQFAALAEWCDGLLRKNGR